MNYHALAPRRYKQSVVAGFVHRIYRAYSTWKNFHDSLQKTNVSFKLFAIHPPSPIHTPSIAILACDSFGPDTKKVGDLNKRGKPILDFLVVRVFLECKSSLAFTPDTEIGCDQNKPDNQIKCDGDGVWMGG